jgi:uncharacterized protein (TIGR03118 family)
MEFRMHFRRDAVLAMAATLAGMALMATATPVRAVVSTSYKVVRLVSDVPGEVSPGSPADADLSNPWGMALSSSSPFWVSDNNTGLLTLYNGEGVKQGLIVTVTGGGGQPANPTGQVFNGDSSAFIVSQAGTSGSAAFIADGEDGGISGWAPGVNATQTVLAVDNSSTGAVYKGLEIVTSGSSPVLLAANLNSGWVEEYSSTWAKINSFRPTDIPADFAPFNIRDLNGTIYVTFTKQDAAKHDEILGPALGIIETLNLTTGTFTDFDRGGKLNAPWGLALAPSDFGSFSNDLLVGNFGNGQILAFNPTTGAYLGTLTGAGGKAIYLPGLWALDFGNNGSGGPADWLYFSSGRFNEAHGLFGYVIAGG